MSSESPCPYRRIALIGCSTYQYTGGLRNADGTVPRRSQYAALAANASSGESHEEDPALVAAEDALTDFIGYAEKSRGAATNLFKAHKQAIGESPYSI